MPLREAEPRELLDRVLEQRNRLAGLSPLDVDVSAGTPR